MGVKLVVIGASAGGLDALDALFSACPSAPGLAFLVVMHLSPDHESTLPERIALATDLQVVPLRADVGIESDRVYVIRPRTRLSLDGRTIRVQQLPEGERVAHSIDVVLESVARTLGDRCAAIILSGTGTDGTRGAAAVRSAGGTVVVQAPDTAEFDGMPLAAIDAGVADLVLPPGQIVGELLKLGAVGPEAYYALMSEAGKAVLAGILAAVQRTASVGFQHYKTATVVRRIHRRMAAVGIHDPRDYLSLVRSSAEEARTLSRDLLIGVTRFERDEGAIAYLRESALPRALSLEPERELRVWVAGCSTGEEAYTVAMILSDLLLSRGDSRDYRIFATDVEPDAVSAASRGLFSADKAKDLPEDARRRYLIEQSDGFLVRRELRDHLLFSCHDVIEDPPFSRLHLVCCRNVLIYFEGPAQERVLRTFANALVDGGVLWLGSSETVSSLDDQFVTLDAQWRFYRARPGRARNVVLPLSRTPHLLDIPSAGRQREQRRLLGALSAALSTYTPPTLIMTTGFRLVYRHGDTGELLRMPAGEPSYDVRDMLPTDLGLVLRRTLQLMEEGQGDDVIHRGMSAQVRGQTATFDLRVRRLVNLDDTPLVALSFEGLSTAPAEPRELPAPVPEHELDAQLADARRELVDVRDNLQATVEELESANEELQSTNEELIASNEELQSTNEELQSVNEELHTVNAEHQHKVRELTELTGELDDVLEATELGVVVLDAAMNLQRFNSVARRYVNLLASDVGRPLAHVTHSLDFVDLLSCVMAVIQSGERARRRTTNQDGSVVMVDITPRHRGQRRIGAILTITDVTALSSIEKIEHQLSTVLDLAGFCLALLDPNGKVLAFNDRFATAVGRDPAHLVGQSAIELCHPDDRRAMSDGVRRCAAGEQWNGIVHLTLPNGDGYWELVDLVGSPSVPGQEASVLRLSRPLAALLPQGVDTNQEERAYWLWYPDEDRACFTRGLGELWGVSGDEVSMQHLAATLRPDQRDLMLAAIQRGLETGRLQRVEVEVERPDGVITLETHLQRRVNPRGGFMLIGQTGRRQEDTTDG